MVKQFSRDPNDDFLLAFCFENSIDLFVTGDNDLLVIEKYFSTQIITFTDFTERYI